MLNALQMNNKSLDVFSNSQSMESNYSKASKIKTIFAFVKLDNN